MSKDNPFDLLKQFGIDLSNLKKHGPEETFTEEESKQLEKAMDEYMKEDDSWIDNKNNP